MAYNRAVNLTGSSGNSLCRLLGSSLERYSEYKKDLCKKENNDRKNADDFTGNLEKSYCDRSPDDTACKYRSGA